MFQRSEIPELFCPFPSAVNPHGAEAEHHSFEWAQRWGLVSRAGREGQLLCAAKSAWFAAYPMPDASKDDLFLASDWAMWLFIHDDTVDHVFSVPSKIASRHAEFVAILDGAAPATDDLPAAHALANLRHRFHDRAPRWWFDRFIQAVKHQFHSHEWEVSNTYANRVPELAAYVKMRPYVYWPCIILAFIASRVRPNPAFLQHASIVSMTAMALNQIVWVNDVIGVNREIAEGSPHNLVLVLQQEYNLSLKEALHRAVQMTDNEMKAFLRLEVELPNFADEEAEVKTYLNTLHAWMRGHLDWYQETNRYPFAPSSSMSSDDVTREHASTLLANPTF
ncbi:MAG TPA: hypothetical protein VJN18_34020 [Polyangiaceae bacterium]|nr:hypothetical protein [Polyangiaceae bacterium]